jgi:hypothetical protein
MGARRVSFPMDWIPAHAALSSWQQIVFPLSCGNQLLGPYPVQAGEILKNRSAKRRREMSVLLFVLALLGDIGIEVGSGD